MHDTYTTIYIGWSCLYRVKTYTFYKIGQHKHDMNNNQVEKINSNLT